ncbi:hypothetical protein A2976_01780 [candidate division WWE3 bacterium RIFCSPLOWO2_01_FULL_41_9]|uniref:Polymerase nucleotidyl transferase domain-containing protein n=2 Tax=Katanobacteria TaxID=422282 RepID=A0A1F4VJL8_UNCKA|nr:MAG: hypothetical protein A2976_01780 [candidate division WWE3 bacterium RIFCSPLOWO2_01_FULL_41_9]
MNVKKRTVCAEAIQNTLAYRSIFKYSLSLYQLRTMLVCGYGISDDVFSRELERMVRKGEVKSRGGKYYSQGYRPVDWKLRAKNSKDLIDNSKHVFSVLKGIPWIKLAGVTGSVAAYSADKSADIDVFVVCTKNRVWITRFFTVILLKMIGKYRSDAEPAGRICPNIFVDENSIKWPKKRRNLYVAHEIVMMHPVVNKEDMYFKFIRANDWIFEFFRDFKIDVSVDYSESKSKQGAVINAVENMLRKYQMWYMKRKRTNEITERTYIHFNREDWSDKILAKYFKLI